MKSAGKARNNGLYRHIRTSKEIIRNLLNDYRNNSNNVAILLPQRALMAKKPWYDWTFSGVQSFPLHRCRGLCSDIVDYAVDSLDLVGDAV